MAKMKTQNKLECISEPTPMQLSMPILIPIPMLKTAEQMSKVCGIGEGKLRKLMDNREIEYVVNGNRRLIADAAVWDWYNRNKICVRMEV